MSIESELTGSHEITRTKLIANSREWPLRIYYSENTCSSTRHVKGTQPNIRDFVSRQNKTSVSSLASWFWISERINFVKFTNQFKYQASFDFELDENKTYRTDKNTPVFGTY